MLTIGSLFSGIGGLELGLEMAGLGPVLWQVERDEYCQRVLAKHWPNVRRFDDVCAVGKENLEPVDIICGGFPCQDLSYAGKGAGLAGARSGLWSELLRIIREVRPRFAVVENVPALLSRGMGVVLGDLAESGYDATWDCIPAAAVGAPHRRDRIFIVGHAHGANVANSAVVLCDGRNNNQVCRSQGGGASGYVPEPRDRARDARSVGHRWPTEPNVGRVADGVPARVDRLRCLGNAVVPQVAERVGWVVRELAGLVEP